MHDGLMLPLFQSIPAIGASLLAQASPPSEGFSIQKILLLAAAAAILILPFVIGPLIAKRLKMPTHGTRFAWILLALAASISILATTRPKQGVDLKGGTILIYQIDLDKIAGNSQDAQVDNSALIQPLTERINPAGTQEIVIRPYGETQIEIIVPEKNDTEVDAIKENIRKAGILKFAIVANQADHQTQINRAVELAQSKIRAERLTPQLKNSAGETIAFWAELGREPESINEARPLRVAIDDGLVRNPTTGQIINLPLELRTAEDPNTAIAQWIDQQDLKSLEILMIEDPLTVVTGADIDFPSSTLDQSGAPAVAFRLTDSGAVRFLSLTTNNIPVGNRKRRLGIVMDDRLLSAPTINSPIGKEGQITGNFTQDEVESLVQILRAGQLPAALDEEPIAQNTIGATLGADTIQKGFFAISVSLGLVLLFILFYYRFAGVVACFALVLNLVMILATMVLINQPITLPGLAGLVLTVGMSVDANVLIFERIREELKKGTAPRLSVRNGFSKATVTIIDANLTTLITAIVLYAIGTDQIRGFAVTLILGILFSMFTAIYVSRTFFDVAERQGILSLSMSDGVNRFRESFSGKTGIDFVSKGKFSLALSAIFVLVGIGAIFARGRTIFDIDFNGGSTVQVQLLAKADIEDVRELVRSGMVDGDEEIYSTVNEVSVEGVPDGTIFKIDSALEDIEKLRDTVRDAFEASESMNLKKNKVSVEPSGQGRLWNRNAALVAAQDDAPENAEATADDTTTTPAETTTTPAETASSADSASGDISAMTLDAANETLSDVATTRTIVFGEDGEATAAVDAATVKSSLREAAKGLGIEISENIIDVEPLGENSEKFNSKSLLRFNRWIVSLPVEPAQADQIVNKMSDDLSREPVFIGSSSIGQRVAGEMVSRAMGALFASLLCIIGYIWFRFQKIIYGLAAVVALIHDVLITLGAIAVSAWLSDALGFLGINEFKISLVVVAAMLTIIGYSLNDTIVVFDRIRETKGKATRLSSEMINTSINQTLSRTLLTSITTLIVVLLLYCFGGAGIHAFAFSLVIGVLVGTYSSIFVASPVLHYLVSREQNANAKPA
ncbi:MAG: protein translocase subunit SecD [Planctomycetota bacterium]